MCEVDGLVTQQPIETQWKALDYLVKYLSCIMVIAAVLQWHFVPSDGTNPLPSVTLNVWDIILRDTLLFSQVMKRS